jgi:hypothetical protein
LIDFQIIETLGVLGTAIATIALVILLWKAVKQMEHTVSLSKIQTDLRFRAWVGPSNGVVYLGKNSDGRHQFEITIKNFGEIPAESVYVFFKQDSNPLTKKTIFDNLEKFNLGALLPNMEKHYWFFVDSEKISKVKEGKEKLFTFLYFEYPIPSGKSGYGMTSQYDPEKEIFVHSEMWVDSPDRQ